MELLPKIQSVNRIALEYYGLIFNPAFRAEATKIANAIKIANSRQVMLKT